MAEYNPRTKQIELTVDDQEALKYKPSSDKKIKDLMDYIIWGDKKENYDNSNSRKD